MPQGMPFLESTGAILDLGLAAARFVCCQPWLFALEALCWAGGDTVACLFCFVLPTSTAFILNVLATSLGGFDHLTTSCAAIAWLPRDICFCSANFITLCCLAWAATAAVIVNLASNCCILFAAPVTAAAPTTLAEAEILSLKFFSTVGLVNLICWSGAM